MWAERKVLLCSASNQYSASSAPYHSAHILWSDVMHAIATKCSVLFQVPPISRRWRSKKFCPTTTFKNVALPRTYCMKSNHTHQRSERTPVIYLTTHEGMKYKRAKKTSGVPRISAWRGSMRGCGVWEGCPPLHWGGIWGGGCAPSPEIFFVFFVKNTVFWRILYD